jgi:hypothetical protein
MAPTLKRLREMTNDEIIEAHDYGASNVAAGVSYWLEELRRREASEQTSKIVWLTWVIAGFTAVNVAFVILTWLRA